MRKFIVIDLGASQTRWLSNFNYTGKVGVVPNETVFVDEDTNVDLMVDTTNILKSLDVSVKKSGSSDFFPLRALIGDTAVKYKATQERPSGESCKSEQRVNYSSVLATCAIALENCTDEDNDIALYLAMPPAEAKTKKEYIKKQFKGKYNIGLNNQKKNITVNITDVEVYEESFLAIMAFLFNENGTSTETSEKYEEGYLLSIDIGASTTDIVAVKDGEYQEHTGRTIKVGGNVVRDTLIDEYTKTSGLEISPEMAAKGVIEGRIRNGNSWTDVSEELNRAKTAYAEDVVYTLDTYFRSKKIPLQNFRAICVSGGGAQSSGYTMEDGKFNKTTEPMSYFITQKLKERNNNIEIENYNGNPREANIWGLFVRAKLDLFQKGLISLDEF